MRKLFFSILLAVCAAQGAYAQNYLDHLRQRKAGEGSVAVTQSKAIDDLVNGKKRQPEAKNTTSDKTAKTGTKQQTVTNHPQNTANQQAETSHQQANTTKDDSLKKTDSTHHEAIPPHRTENENADEMEIPTVDMRKKVMRRSYKVTGYRVQAYAGGNTRNDRRKAESIRDNIKMKFPDEPVYVHFYSPRWLCRVGNYRSYEEASHMLTQIKQMGYRSATIVRGKITVQY